MYKVCEDATNITMAIRITSFKTNDLLHYTPNNDNKNNNEQILFLVFFILLSLNIIVLRKRLYIFLLVRYKVIAMHKKDSNCQRKQ